MAQIGNIYAQDRLAALAESTYPTHHAHGAPDQNFFMSEKNTTATLPEGRDDQGRNASRHH